MRRRHHPAVPHLAVAAAGPRPTGPPRPPELSSLPPPLPPPLRHRGRRLCRRQPPSPRPSPLEKVRSPPRRRPPPTYPCTSHTPATPSLPPFRPPGRIRALSQIPTCIRRQTCSRAGSAPQETKSSGFGWRRARLWRPGSAGGGVRGREARRSIGGSARVVGALSKFFVSCDVFMSVSTG